MCTDSLPCVCRTSVVVHLQCENEIAEWNLILLPWLRLRILHFMFFFLLMSLSTLFVLFFIDASQMFTIEAWSNQQTIMALHKCWVLTFSFVKASHISGTIFPYLELSEVFHIRAHEDSLPFILLHHRSMWCYPAFPGYLAGTLIWFSSIPNDIGCHLFSTLDMRLPLHVNLCWFHILGACNGCSVSASCRSTFQFDFFNRLSVFLQQIMVESQNKRSC